MSDPSVGQLVCRPLTREQALDAQELRVPWLCECGQGDPPEHVICSACGDDWDECACGAPDDEDATWMLADVAWALEPTSRGRSDG